MSCRGREIVLTSRPGDRSYSREAGSRSGDCSHVVTWTSLLRSGGEVAIGRLFSRRDLEIAPTVGRRGRDREIAPTDDVFFD